MSGAFHPSSHLHGPLSEEENDFGVRGTWSPVLESVTLQLDLGKSLNLYEPRISSSIRWS